MGVHYEPHEYEGFVYGLLALTVVGTVLYTGYEISSHGFGSAKQVKSQEDTGLVRIINE